MFAALASGSRLTQRAFSSTCRTLQKKPLRATPETPSPADLLAKIGRGAEKKLAPSVESWDALSEVYAKGTPALEAVGLGVKDRRYILWALSRYSQGDAPSSFITPPRPAKKYRGWGPRVQNGKRVR